MLQTSNVCDGDNFSREHFLHQKWEANVGRFVIGLGFPIGTLVSAPGSILFFVTLTPAVALPPLFLLCAAM